MLRDAAEGPDVEPNLGPFALGNPLQEEGPASVRRRRVLVIAYYFPPMGLSGVQRTAKFVKYLHRAGWEATVLTCDPGGYFAFDRSLLIEVEEAGVEIVRTRGWDPTAVFRRQRIVALPEEQNRRRLTILSQLLFVPDNKIGWFRSARAAGLRALRNRSFHLIFSTAPPYTSHLIGRSLAVRTSIPLVLDFRDDWVGNPRHIYPTPLHRSISTRLERAVLRSADRIVVINDFIRGNLLHRNGDVLRPDDVDVVTQGYDPQDFQGEHESSRTESSRFTLLYSGVFYDVQMPDYFLRALADLLSRRPELRDQVEAVFVGLLPESVDDLVARLGLDTIVRHTGYLPHDDSIAHLRRADVLWMTVGRIEGSETISTSKLFEYFGARKPILGLVPPGAAREALAQYGAAEIVEPDAVSDISGAIERLFEAWKAGRLPVPAEQVVRKYDRATLAMRLGAIFDAVLAEH